MLDESIRLIGGPLDGMMVDVDGDRFESIDDVPSHLLLSPGLGSNYYLRYDKTNRPYVYEWFGKTSKEDVVEGDKSP